MSLSVIWKSGDDSVEILTGGRIGFFGTNFGESIPLDNYQDTTVVTNATGTINNGALSNVKFINASQGNWGNGTQDMTALTSDSATLHIKLTSGSASRLQAVNLFAYSGSTQGPSNMNIKGFEVGGANTVWTDMSGSSSPLALTPRIDEAQEEHDYYIAISASPTTTGVNTAVSLRIYAEWY